MLRKVCLFVRVVWWDSKSEGENSVERDERPTGRERHVLSSSSEHHIRFPQLDLLSSINDSLETTSTQTTQHRSIRHFRKSSTSIKRRCKWEETYRLMVNAGTSTGNPAKCPTWRARYAAVESEYRTCLHSLPNIINTNNHHEPYKKTPQKTSAIILISPPSRILSTHPKCTLSTFSSLGNSARAALLAIPPNWAAVNPLSLHKQNPFVSSVQVVRFEETASLSTECTESGSFSCCDVNWGHLGLRDVMEVRGGMEDGEALSRIPWPAASLRCFIWIFDGSSSAGWKINLKCRWSFELWIKRRI